jgi:MtaA/CmuA family methyltransferase
MQNFQNTAFLVGMKLSEFCQSASRMAESQLAAWDRFGYDVLDLENGTAAIAEALGCEVEYPENEPPRVVKPALTCLEDIQKLKEVDPFRAGHLPELIEATRLIRKGLGKRACIVGEADQGAFSLAALLTGIETWLEALLVPEKHILLHQLLEFCNRQILKFALAQFDAGADFVQIGDSLAGPDVCSPRIYKKFALPYEQHLAAELNLHKIPLIIHICGNATPIISDMAVSGATMLEIDYKADAARCRDVTQGKTILIGNVDPSGIMALGTPDAVIEQSRKAIQSMGKYGGFILSPGCTLPANTPAENTTAMMEAARQYGRYGPAGLIV